MQLLVEVPFMGEDSVDLSGDVGAVGRILMHQPHSDDPVSPVPPAGTGPGAPEATATPLQQDGAAREELPGGQGASSEGNAHDMVGTGRRGSSGCRAAKGSGDDSELEAAGSESDSGGREDGGRHRNRGASLRSCWT